MTRPFRERKEAQQKLYQAEAVVEAKNWEKRNRDHSFQEINQEFESQRFRLNQASRWADQAQRKISLYGELELRCRLFQENHARDCQEIQELRNLLRRNWANETSKKRTTEESYDRESDDGSNSGFTEQVNSLREFYDPESGSSSGATHVPEQTSTILSSRTLPRCDSGLPRNTHNCTGITGNRFARPPAQEGQSSTIFNNSKILASSSQGLGPGIAETALRQRSGKRIVECVDSITSLQKF